MRAFARFALPSGVVGELGHGDIIGRVWSAQLRLDDPRVSEAHAMVSLRGQALQLLALRGRFAVGRRPLKSIDLAAGMRVLLAEDLTLEVLHVQLPAEVLAIEADGLARQILAGTCSLRMGPKPQLVPGFRRGADATLWTSGEAWRIQVGGGEPTDVKAGDTLTVAEREVRLVAVALDEAAQRPTRVRGRLSNPLRIVARFETVHIHRDGDAALVLGGIGGRILSELAAYGVPVPWHVLAGEIWPGEEDRDHLRNKLDVNLARLRRKLRDANVRADLVHADGSGNYELLMYDHDQVEDET